MADCQYYHENYFYLTMYADIVETGGNYHKVHWKIVMHHSRLNVSAFSFNWYVNDNSGTINYGAINVGSGGQDRTLGEGDVWVWHSDGVNIGFGFSSGIRWKDYTKGGYLAYDPSANGSLWLPQLTVNPTLPNSVTANGTNNSWWLDKDSPNFNVSWSGASSGTFTINQYSIDASKNGWANSWNVSSLATSAGSGSKNNVSLSSLGLSGGENINIRVGMQTTDGTWWGHTYWGGSFHIYSRPSAPSTLSAPSSQEIDTSFNVTWSGAKAGSEGISKYQLQRRVYNGSTWSDWTTVVDKNTTSYTAGSPRSITGSTSDACQIQFRVRAFDGHYAYSDWKTVTTKIYINSPTVPRK